MSTFLLEIITPERRAFSEQVDMVTVPTYMGTVGVMAHHMPLFAALSEGEVKIAHGSKELFLAIGGGFMEVTKSHVSILVSAAAHADELNEAEIKRAREEAKEALGRKVTGEQMRQAQALLRRTTVELNMLRRMRRKSSSVPTARA